MNKREARLLVYLGLAVAAGCSPSARDRAELQVPPTAVAPPAAAAPAEEPRGPAIRTSETAAAKGDKAAPDAAKPPQSRSIDELLLFFPTKFPDGDWQPRGLDFEDVWFNAADGTRRHGWYCPCAEARAVVLYAHGNGGNLSLRAPLLRRLQRELRVTTFIFDYRGYGRSEGAPTVEGILQDARAARTWLAGRAGVPESAVVLMGRSLGGAVVVQLAAESRPRGLILESTFSSLREAAAHHYPRLAWLVPAGKLDSAAKLARYSGPLLQSHGDADRTVPYESGRKLFQAAKGPKRFITIPGADHNQPQSAEYYRELERFIGGL